MDLWQRLGLSYRRLRHVAIPGRRGVGARGQRVGVVVGRASGPGDRRLPKGGATVSQSGRGHVARDTHGGASEEFMRERSVNSGYPGCRGTRRGRAVRMFVKAERFMTVLFVSSRARGQPRKKDPCQSEVPGAEPIRRLPFVKSPDAYSTGRTRTGRSMLLACSSPLQLKDSCSYLFMEKHFLCHID